ncbi:MAG: efflux RND transporter periplasmic adaptor subunit [Pseudomonadota bacterium]|nr:efflux RND transporter periplasmic adaptor subunit [Pseudomonadota bacterium]
MEHSFTRWIVFLMLLFPVSFTVQAETPAHAEAVFKNYAQQWTFDGSIEAVNQATVSSRVSAQVADIFYDVNDRVEKDALILRFNDEEIKTRLWQAEANLLAEQAQLKEVQARYTEAAAEAKRINDLYQRKQVTRSALDKAEADKAATAARVNVLNAQIKARQAEVEQAKVELSYTEVRAPYAGVMTKRWIEVGEMATPGQALMSGLSLDNLRVVFTVPQKQLTEVMAAKLDVLLPTGEHLTQLDKTLIPAADTQTHSFHIRLDLPQNLNDIFPGMTTKVTAYGSEQPVLVIPKQALVKRAEVDGVYVLAQQRVVLRQLRVGTEYDDGWVEVLSGIDAGEQVITQPDMALLYLQQQHD